MATIQSVHLLSVNGLTPGNNQTGFPGTQPTAASPSPVFGLSNAHIQGVSPIALGANTTFPTAQSIVYVDYFNSAQKQTGFIYCSETAAAIITAS